MGGQAPPLRGPRGASQWAGPVEQTTEANSKSAIGSQIRMSLQLEGSLPVKQTQYLLRYSTREIPSSWIANG